MRLASMIQDHKVTIGGDTYRLEPSLRAAYTFACRHGGYEALLRDLSENSITAMQAVLLAACGEDAARQFMHAASCKPLGRILFNADAEFGLDPPTPLNEILIRYVLGLLDIDPDEPPKQSAGGPSKPIKEALEDLFEIGGGWLGWTPEDTWEAAPAEIAAAYKGRIALLRAIFGGKDNETDENKEPDFSRDDAAKIRALAGLSRAV